MEISANGYWIEDMYDGFGRSHNGLKGESRLPWTNMTQRK
jgi:hypothetical protein